MVCFRSGSGKSPTLKSNTTIKFNPEAKIRRSHAPKNETSSKTTPIPFVGIHCIERGVKCSGEGELINRKTRSEFFCQQECFEREDCKSWTYSALSLVCRIRNMTCEGIVQESARISGLGQAQCEAYASMIVLLTKANS